MLFSYNWLKDYVKDLPEPRKLADLLTLHSFEVGDVKKTGGDFVFDIDVLPNRAHDCFCHLGVAREIAAILNKKLNIPRGEKLKAKKGRLKSINLKIQCPRLVPRYSAIVIEDIRMGKSPRWLREKLEAVGIRSINNIVDLTNFIMRESNQSLHAFDYDKIREQKMVLRQAKKGEKVVTLDGVSRTLDEGILVIEDKNRLIDLVGIMGGKLSEIGPKTKNIVLQAGNFDRRAIYQAAKVLSHSTEASNIYSQGIDSNLTVPALERAQFLLKELGAGKIVQIIDVYPKKVSPKIIKLDLNYVKSLLGAKISEREIKNILERLGLKTEGSNVVVPTFRQDISIPEDLIEEIGRIYGYEKIPPTFPTAVLIPAKRNDEIFWENMAKDILKEAGFTEVYNYSFVSEKALGAVELENPTSTEYKYLRSSLIPNLLKNVEKNLKYTRGIKIFELGKVFSGRKEKRQLTGLMADQDFYQLKGTVDLLLQGLGISNIWYDDYKATPEGSPFAIWHQKRSAEIKVDGMELGFLGELRGKPGIVVFDIDFEKLQKLASEEHEYLPLSKFPSAVRDLAILVPLQTRVDQVLNRINTAGGKLVRDVDLFDIYEGEELPQGRKNLAFHIIYQAEDRTLKSKEIDEIHKKIIKALEQSPGWQVRK